MSINFANPIDIMVATPRLQVIAGRGRVMGPDANTAQTGYTRHETRIQHRIKGAKFTGVRPVYGNFQARLDDQSFPNSLVMSAAYERLTSPNIVTPLFFNGARYITLQPDTALVMPDPLPYEIDASTTVFQAYVRTNLELTSGQSWPVGYFIGTAIGEGVVNSNAASTQIDAIGALTTPSGGVTQTNGFHPVAILGIPDRPTKAIFAMTDSIGTGAAEVQNSGGDYGFIGRAGRMLDVAYLLAGHDGNSSSTYDPQVSRHAFALMPYCNIGVSQLGTNDGVGGLVVAQSLANHRSLWARMKAAGIRKVIACTCPPRIQSTTNNFLDAAGQTPFSGYEAGGSFRDPFNAALFAELATNPNLDYVFDVNQYWEDQANRGKWISNGAQYYATPDGFHPQPALHILAAAGFATLINSITLY